ncbi:hypothetical protein C0993_002033 [Termitomyces sp. T159_Od127]|nr:hypothetical protein C0993_002033 [Termitomyces sp. T159_Od127]
MPSIGNLESPDWDDSTADQNDEGDSIHADVGTQQVRISIEDILSAMSRSQYRGLQNIRISGFSRLLSALSRDSAIRGPPLDDPDEDDDDDDDDDDDYDMSFGTAVGAQWKCPKTTEPQKEGVELLNSGDFGRVGCKARTRRNHINLANLILNQSRSVCPVSSREDYAAAPTSRTQRGTAPPQAYPGLQTNMKVRKSIQGHPGRWTITDANLSPDNERFFDNEDFGIWSCRFSADGNEVIAGGSGNIFVYDLLAHCRTVKIHGHTADVNSCCWADTASGNVLVSASDDTLIKVWDRRSLGASAKPSGVLIGHTEGVTYVSAKGDGRYIVSNGKDQAMRLWDLRKMRSNQEFEEVRRKRYGVPDFDYRYPPYPGPRVDKHPKDCSVMTYYGHSVLRTLIRCHFSPMETTGAQYLYSGSADGRIHIWSLDGRVVQVLDRSMTLPLTFDPSQPELPSMRSRRRAPCVRDVSWHSQEPVMMSAAWESSMSGSTIARHEWKGLLRMRGALEDWVEKDRLEREDRTRRRSSRLRNQRRIPGAFQEDDMDEAE